MDKLRHIAALLGLMCSVSAMADTEITSISEIRSLSDEDAKTGIPVEVKAQIIHIHPMLRNWVYLSNGPPGIFCSFSRVQSSSGLKTGDFIHVKGVTTYTAVTPAIRGTSLKIIERRPMPEPKKITIEELAFPSYSRDCTWVSLSGRLVKTSTLQGMDYLLLKLEKGGITADIQLPYSEAARQRVEELMFLPVQVKGMLATAFNRRKQMLRQLVVLNSVNDLTPTKQSSGEGFFRPISQLMAGSDDHSSLVRTRGTVTFCSGNEFYLQDKAAALKVTTIHEMELEPGTEVEITGYIWPQPISPAFRARSVEVISNEAPLEPEPLRFPLDSNQHYSLISIEATLIDYAHRTKGWDEEENALVCRSGELLFEAVLPETVGLPNQIEPGSELLLGGICAFNPNNDPMNYTAVDRLHLMVRSSDDIHILKTAPWWNTKRLLILLSALAGIVAFFTLWIIALQKTVERQTRMISDKIEHESVLQERQRLARELHDNVAQGLAGIAIQLRSSLKLIDREQAPEKVKSAVQLLQGMVTHCSDEARMAIMDLRSGLLERMDLPAAIRKTVKPLAEECGARLLVEANGDSRRLTPAIERNLLAIIKEATTNAARHAEPEQITVTLNFDAKELCVVIEDDGKGFDSTQTKKTKRFGLRGMNERVNRLQGELSIKSRPGRGTKIRVCVPTTEKQ